MKYKRRWVSSGEIPRDIAERVALQSHARGCDSFDGGRANRRYAAPPFVGAHAASDIVWAQIHLADMCSALGIEPAALVALTDGGGGEAP